MKKILKILDKVAPHLAARLIYNRISQPQKRKLREMEERVLAKSESQSINYRDFTLKEYSWGKKENHIALLIHGWEGQAGNFGALIPILLEKHYHVVAYDGPSHGKSSRKSTNMFEYADFISTRIKTHQPKLIISHSFGTVSTQLGLLKNPDFKLNQWIIVTTPFSFIEFILTINRKLRMSQKTLQKLSALIEKDANFPLEEINMKTLCPKMNPIDSVVIVHSEDDKVLSFHDAERTSKCIADSELIKLKHIGHYKILWSDELKNIINKKVNNY